MPTLTCIFTYFCRERLVLFTVVPRKYCISRPYAVCFTFFTRIIFSFFVCVSQGSVYLSGTGSEERMSVVPLQDEANGVVSSMHCFELHHEHLLQDNVAYCEALKARYDDHEYGDLMNTTFSLVPSGRSPGTYRLGEVKKKHKMERGGGGLCQYLGILRGESSTTLRGVALRRAI